MLYSFTLILFIFPIIITGQDGQQPIIDMHLHGYSEDVYYVATAPDGTVSPSTFKEYAEEVNSLIKKYHIVKAVVSAKGKYNYEENEDVFIPGRYYEDPPKDTTEFKRLIEDGKLKVFGELAPVFAGKTIADPEYDPFLKICDRYNIPVVLHTGGGPPGITKISPNFRITKGDPYTAEEILVRYPKLKICLMHSGISYYEHTLEIMKTYPQVYTDLGVILWYDTYEKDIAEAFLRKAKRYGFIDRVLFGSDQMVWPHAIEKSIKQLDSYDFLTPEDKRDIFYNTAIQFLDIDQ